jgi:hypothetical protein
MENSEEKRPVGRHRRSWEDNIKIHLGEIERGDIDWINLIQERGRWSAHVKRVMYFRVP